MVLLSCKLWFISLSKLLNVKFWSKILSMNYLYEILYPYFYAELILSIPWNTCIFIGCHHNLLNRYPVSYPLPSFLYQVRKWTAYTMTYEHISIKPHSNIIQYRPNEGDGSFTYCVIMIFFFVSTGSSTRCDLHPPNLILNSMVCKLGYVN